MNKNIKRALCITLAAFIFACVMTACGNGRIPDGNAENGRVTEKATGDLSTVPQMPDMSDISEGIDDIAGDISEGIDNITGSMSSTDNNSTKPEGTSSTPSDGDELTTGAVNTTAPSVSDDTENNPRVLFGENINSANTLTGYAKLSPVRFEVNDPENTRGLSVKKMCHSHGPASNGEAHYTVKEFQKHFDEYGALTLDTVSEGKRLYLTFDCGYEHNNLTSKILDVLKEKNVPAAFFCTLHHIKSQPELITRMIKEGHIVGNHSDTHPSFAEISRTQMAQEIENCDNFLREEYGYSAKFFRFPAGEYNDSALELVKSIGFTSVFWSVAYSDWDVDNPKGKDYAVKTVMERLHPGAVILLHAVSQDNADALGEIIDRARSEGYEFFSLDKAPQI